MDNFYGIHTPQLDAHMHDVQKQFNNNQIVYLALVGSQNYGLDTPESDIDTKCCVLPSWKDITQAHQPYGHTYIRDNNEHIDITDFRSMMNILKKQNINFLEQLFTYDYLINETYSHEIEELRRHREAIAHYNPYKCVQTMGGIAKSKESRILRPLGEEKNKTFEKFGYHPKELAQLYRIYCFLASYTRGLTFEISLKNVNRIEYLTLKTEKLPIEEVKDTIEFYISSVKEVEQNFLATHENTHAPAVDSLMEEITESIFKKYLRNFV